jgi:type II secretory pathway component PulF
MQHKAEPKPKQQKFLGISTAHPWKSSTWIPGSALRDSQATLMAVLRAGIQQSLPLPLLIQSLASEYPGGYRITLLKLAKLLEQGVPLIDALEQVPDALSEHDVLGLRLGKQSGMLIPALLEMKSTEAENITTPGLRLWRDAWIYWLVVIGIMLVVITYIKYRVAGTLRNINAELGISNPLRFMSGFLDSVLWIWGIFLVIVLFLIATGWSFRLRRWIRGMFGFPASHIGESNVSVLRLLGMTVKNGRPLVGALSTIAKYHTHGAIRNKMLLARNEIEQGAEVWDALRSVHFLRASQAEALRGESSATQAWLLRSFAREQKDNLEDRERVWVAWLYPIMVLILGTIIFLLSVGVFGFLSNMISSVAR